MFDGDNCYGGNNAGKGESYPKPHLMQGNIPIVIISITVRIIGLKWKSSG